MQEGLESFCHNQGMMMHYSIIVSIINVIYSSSTLGAFL